MRILAVVGAVLIGALLLFLGAWGARWLAPAPSDGDAAVEITPTASEQRSEPGTGKLDLATVRELLALLEPAQRGQILESPESFARFINQETLNQAVLAAAYANGADETEAIRVLMKRAGQRVLVESYLNQVVRLNLDPAFPSEAQVREAYDKNPDAFRVPQRMHLWQIYIPLAADADDAAYKAAWALADRISADLRKGKTSFAEMAKAHSAHEASRLNDGYMGLIKVAELLPPIAEAAAALKVDGVSDPIATDTGLHIIKRGATVEEEVVEFAKVREQIAVRLKREAALKVRQAALEKISAEYPVESPGDELEAWRENLLAAPATTPTPAAAAKGGS